jgi:hypothetical protein
VTRHLHDLSNENLAPLITVGNTRNQGKEMPEAPVQLIKAKTEDALPDLFNQIKNWPPTAIIRPHI